MPKEIVSNPIMRSGLKFYVGDVLKKMEVKVISIHLKNWEK